MDFRCALRRQLCRFWSLWRPRLEGPRHCSGEDRQLADGGALSGIISSLPPILCLDKSFFLHLVCILADVFLSVAHPLRRNSRSRTSRPKECLGKGTLHCGNHWFLGIDLRVGSQQGIEVFGTCDADWRSLFDRWVVGPGICEQREECGDFVSFGKEHEIMAVKHTSRLCAQEFVSLQRTRATSISHWCCKIQEKSLRSPFADTDILFAMF